MSNIRIDNIAPSAGGTYRNAPRGIAAAWVNFNGTGTVAIRDSENVGSITDNGVGGYAVNFTAAMAAGDYMTAGSCRSPGALSGAALQFDVYNTTNIIFYTRATTGGSESDFVIITASIHGDLA